MESIFQARPGVYPDLPNGAYHASAGLSKTGVSRLLRAPKLYKACLDNPGLGKSTRSQQIGSLFHMVMEGAFERDCAVSPTVKDKRQREWKDFEKAHPGKICVTPEEAAAAFAMRDALLTHGAAKELLSQPGRFEVSFYWNDKGTGQLFKCRPDFITADQSIVIDFKTCQDASEAAFVRAAERYHYHLSAAITSEGVLTITGTRPRYIFLAIEPQAPFLCAAYEATAEDMDAGMLLFRRALARLGQCEKTQSWPGLSEEIRPLDVGRWRGRGADHDDEIESSVTAEKAIAGEWWT